MTSRRRVRCAGCDASVMPEYLDGNDLCESCAVQEPLPLDVGGAT